MHPEILCQRRNSQKPSPENPSGLAVILNDACQLNAINFRSLVNQDYKVRVTSEGEGVEP
jgi:hypothetical protein